MELTIAEIGHRLESAGRLRAKPLCVYGAEEAPEGLVPIGKIDRCVAKAMLMISYGKGKGAYLGDGALGGCCPGGTGWLGHTKFAEGLKHFISTGDKSFRGGAAEFLKRRPELVEASYAKVGEIKAMSRYTVIRWAEEINEDPGVHSIMCFGTAEQVRNLTALNHFGTDDVFGSALMPWGPTCATLVTYPAGLAANAPRDAVFVGPVDPTGNEWFPEDFMAIAMPLRTARRMCEDLELSFIAKRSTVAYPDKRGHIGTP